MNMNLTVINATDKSFGRLASQVAKILMGKTRPSYRAHLMPEEKVVIENIDKIKFTGNKLDRKTYYRHSKFPGSIKERTLRQRWEKNPRDVLRKTVLDMLPKNKLQTKIIQRLIFK